MGRLSMMLVLALVAVSCGGEGDEGAEPTSAAVTTTETEESSTQPEEPAEGQEQEPAGTTVAPAPSSADVSGIGEASVTIGGETYLFGETGAPLFRCETNLFGIFWVILGMVDESGNEIPQGGNVGLVLLGEGTDPDEVDQVPVASIRIGATDEEWVADPTQMETLTELEPGMSQVDSYTIDGNSVSGTATFFEKNNSYWAFVGGSVDAIEVSEGTFEATCAE